MPAFSARAGTTLQRLCFIAILAFSGTFTSATARADTPATQIVRTSPVGASCVGWTWSRLFAPIENAVGNQKNMIRFGVIAFVSALYIIWWRK